MVQWEIGERVKIQKKGESLNGLTAKIIRKSTVLHHWRVEVSVDPDRRQSLSDAGYYYFVHNSTIRFKANDTILVFASGQLQKLSPEEEQKEMIKEAAALQDVNKVRFLLMFACYFMSAPYYSGPFRK